MLGIGFRVDAACYLFGGFESFRMFMILISF